MSDDPLASWNHGSTKATLLDFIARVTKEGTADFVPPEERIATFDNDGTLWPEQPMYIQFVFAFDRVKRLSRSTRNGRRRSHSRRCSRGM